MKKIRKLLKKSEQPLTLLGGISADQFLSEYWHKKPLLIRGAIPHFQDLLSPEQLAGLACEDDVQSRLVSVVKNQWRLEHGPLDEKRFLKLPSKNWTLLVQSVNHHLMEASALLQQFNFIPSARLDDLMVSYAPDGGGVGPHFDSYDVFLLQGRGQRSWRISQQWDLSLIDDAPLRILKNFTSEQEWLLDAGDMLYLPPHVAHWGVAVGDCMTYSIGFRAPSTQELASEFLSFLQDRCQLQGRYADPHLKSQRHPAKISEAMLGQVDEMLKKLEWDKSSVAEFLGGYLTEPKPDVLFDPPKPNSLANFTKQLFDKGIVLSLKSQMLFYNRDFYLNGETISVNKASLDLMRRLADNRQLSHDDLTGWNDPLSIQHLHAWYLAGYVLFLPRRRQAA